MAGRAQRSRGKHSPHNKKKKGRQSQLKPAPQKQAVSLASEVTVPAKVVIPLSNAPAPVSIVTRCPNLLVELRRVGILAGIVLVILLVLARVL